MLGSSYANNNIITILPIGFHTCTSLQCTSPCDVPYIFVSLGISTFFHASSRFTRIISNPPPHHRPRNLPSETPVPLCVQCSSSRYCFAAVSGTYRLLTYLWPEIGTSRPGRPALTRIADRVPCTRLFVLRATSRRDLRRPTNRPMNRTTSLRPDPQWTNIPVFRPARPISDSRWWSSSSRRRSASGRPRPPRRSCTGRSACGTTTSVLTIEWPPSSSPSNSNPVSWSLHGVI